MAKVSVIIPVYNVEAYLRQCLDSVISQTLDDIEVICINDGSTDNSLDILNEYSQKYDNFKVFSQKNSGQGSARNRGIEEACGDYIFFQDADDYIIHDALEKLYENAISNDSDIVFYKFARFDNQGKINYKRPGFNFKKELGDVDFSNFTFDYTSIKGHVLNSSFAPWCKLHKKSFLKRFDDFIFPQSIAYEDMIFHVKEILRANKISFVDEFLYYYRDNPSSTVNITHGFDIFRMVDMVEDFLKTENLINEFEEEFKLFKVTQLLNYLILSQSEEYFNLTKEEFLKFSIGENSLLTSYKLSRYKFVLESDNLLEYTVKHYKLVENKLNKKIDKLTKENNKLKKKNKSLTNQTHDNKIKKIFSTFR